MFNETFNPDGTVNGIGMLDSQGKYTWFSIESSEYLKWLAEGNVPTPAEENT